MKSIAIFGGTGMSGLCAVQTALDKGLKVKLLVRHLEALPDEYKNKEDVQIVNGDARDFEAVKKTVEGQDAVVVALGTRRRMAATTELSEGLKNIIEAMKECKIRVVSVCLSAFLFLQLKQVPFVFQEITKEHQRMLDILKESDLDWIGVLPPHIEMVDPPSRYQIKYNSSSLEMTITKHDLGEFLVKALSEPKHYRKLCGISNIPMPVYCN